MKIAVLMDPITHLKAYKDTTVAMLESAQRLGCTCFYFTPKDLSCRAGRAFARVTSITIKDIHTPGWAEVQEMGEYPLNAFDVILMRKDPPFNMQYIYCTYALELAEKEGVLVVNKPQSLRDANEKFFTLQFPQCCPSTLVSMDIEELRTFWATHQNVIFKPLEGMGGNAVFHVNERGMNLSVILEVLTQSQTISIMAQEYIPAISTGGDKRVLLINGEPVPYGLARIPAVGELRGNLAAGAQGKVVAITDRDRWICSEIGATLREKGLFFVGIDVIGDYLTEINVTSPTCAREIMNESQLDITGQFIQTLIDARLHKG